MIPRQDSVNDYEKIAQLLFLKFKEEEVNNKMINLRDEMTNIEQHKLLSEEKLKQIKEKQNGNTNNNINTNNNWNISTNNDR